MTSRERFEAWITAPPYEKQLTLACDRSPWPGQYVVYQVQLAWEAWQSAEAATARRCLEIAELEGHTILRIYNEYPEAFK